MERYGGTAHGTVSERDVEQGSLPEPVSVEIYDQVYNLRGTDAEHIERLAALVDGKMRAVAAHGTTVDSLRVAVLAGLNIADELLALRGALRGTGAAHTDAGLDALARGYAGRDAG
jgi:cell division protein ZapA